MNFAYYLFLLLIIFLCLILLKKNIQVSPKKIKIYVTMVITLFLLRHITLFVLCIIKNSTVIYKLKSIIFLNHIAVPLMILAITYVYLRSEKLKFSINYIVAAIIIITYSFIIYISQGTVKINTLYGFKLNIDKEIIMFLFSLILLAILFMFNVFILDKPFINKKGVYLIILSISIVMIEDIIVLGGIRFFPYPVVGDFIFLIIMNLVLNGFKKMRIDVQ